MKINELIKELEGYDCKGLYQDDFFLTWDKSQDELMAKIGRASCRERV